MKNKIIFSIILVLSMFITFAACDQKSDPLTVAKIQAAYDKVVGSLTDEEIVAKQADLGKNILAELKLKDQVEWAKALTDSKLIESAGDINSIVSKVNLIVLGTYIVIPDFTDIMGDATDAVTDVTDAVTDVTDTVSDVVEDVTTAQLTVEAIQAAYDSVTVGKTEEDIANNQVEIAEKVLSTLGVDEAKWSEATADMQDDIVTQINIMLAKKYE